MFHMKILAINYIFYGFICQIANNFKPVCELRVEIDTFIYNVAIKYRYYIYLCSLC